MAFISPHRGQNPPPLLKVSGYIPADIHQYFERLTLGHGYVTFFINHFYTRLKAACDAAEIPGAWDPDTEAKIMQFLSNLNFNPPPAPTPTKSKAPRKAKTL